MINAPFLTHLVYIKVFEMFFHYAQYKRITIWDDGKFQEAIKAFSFTIEDVFEGSIENIFRKTFHSSLGLNVVSREKKNLNKRIWNCLSVMVEIKFLKVHKTKGGNLYFFRL